MDIDFVGNPSNEEDDDDECIRMELLSPPEVLKASVDPTTRRIYLSGVSITPEIAQQFLVNLHFLESMGPAPITVFLFTCGGHEGSGYLIFDAIRMSPCEVSIVCYGDVYSMGSIILQAGDVRLMAPNATLMVHNGQYELHGEVQSSIVVALGKEAGRSNKKMHRILADRSGQSLKAIQQLCETETYIAAANCLKLGLIDKVLAPSKKFKKKSQSRKK